VPPANVPDSAGAIHGYYVNVSGSVRVIDTALGRSVLATGGSAGKAPV
jgi:hypothetical protein